MLRSVHVGGLERYHVKRHGLRIGIIALQWGGQEPNTNRFWSLHRLYKLGQYQGCGESLEECKTQFRETWGCIVSIYGIKRVEAALLPAHARPVTAAVSTHVALRKVMARKIALNVNREFPVPIRIGKKTLRTLKDAALLYQAQSPNVQNEQAWKTAWELIARAADDAGWMLFTEMAIVRAANPSQEKAFNPNFKEPNWRPRKKRDPWRDR